MRWRPIATAPTDGTPIRIRGLTFMALEDYEAVVIWTARKCPEHICEGWFPATDKHDGMGPYEDVTDWAPLTA